MGRIKDSLGKYRKQAERYIPTKHYERVKRASENVNWQQRSTQGKAEFKRRVKHIRLRRRR